jgi:hypothetical protein
LYTVTTDDQSQQQVEALAPFAEARAVRVHREAD